MTPVKTVLVVGAGGILAPAATSLVAGGADVTGIGRSRAMPEGVHALFVDATDAAALRTALGDRRFDEALVYGRTVTDASMRALRERVASRVAFVRTSAGADPANGDLDVPDDVLQLGWHEQPDGTTRWHTPVEVSELALAVLGDGRPRILGVVRPWSARP